MIRPCPLPPAARAPEAAEPNDDDDDDDTEESSLPITLSEQALTADGFKQQSAASAAESLDDRRKRKAIKRCMSPTTQDRELEAWKRSAWLRCTREEALKTRPWLCSIKRSSWPRGWM
jgi:hypothetical protein